jgi:(4S)-4-hydroxy-5-phosphonooxypentane-2,3-dione isomerase
MNRFVLIVDFQVKPEHLERFNQLIEVNARSSVANEPGCLQFDVLRNREDSRNVVLYEVYESEDAFKSHLGMAHTRTFLSEMKELIIKQTATQFTRMVAPPVKQG